MMDTFGEIMMKRYPNVTTSDLSGEQTMKLAQAFDDVITEWIGNNAVDHGT